MDKKLFLNYSADCELPLCSKYTGGKERASFLGGPESWEFAQKSAEGFIVLMDDVGASKGATIFVYPDVAREQKQLYRDFVKSGIEMALHLNGQRYSYLDDESANWLGKMNYSQQKDVLEYAKKDLEDLLGIEITGYRACYGSANDDTFKILDEIGFKWASNSRSRCRLETAANWWNSWPYPHFTSGKSKLIPGQLDVYEIPITCGVDTFFEGDKNKPTDLRVETPTEILGQDRALLKKIVKENIDDMLLMDVPVKTVIGASHNTSDYGNFEDYRSQNLRWLVKHIKDLCDEYDLEFVPARFDEITEYAKHVNSY